MQIDESLVRDLAQGIWETEGKPDGHGVRHWEMATKLAESVARANTRNAVVIPFARAPRPRRRSISRFPWR